MRVNCAALAALTAFLSLDFLSAHLTGQQKEQNLGNGDTAQKKKPPHIIFILIDDQGFNDIGYHNPTIKTPTLDKLAAEGVILENYYVQPICTPSRSQLMTGRYQIHTGLQHSIIRPSQPSCLPPNMDTLPERLREAGYSTHMVGKWHLGFYRKSCLPTRKGFDTFFGSLTGSVDYYSYGSCDGAALCGYDLHDNESVAWGREGKYSTFLFTQRARKILESHDPVKRPLFLLLSLQAVHTPLQPPKSYIYPYRDMTNVNRRKYAAMVSTVDEAVRNLTYALRKFGFYKNSVIVYSTDNGAQPLTGGSNWPLRGQKGTYWEGGVRGVAFVHSPLLKRRRRVSRDLLHITDWFPTLVGLGGGDISQSRGLDGFDVWATISEGKASPRQEILHNINPLHRPSVSSMSWGDTKTKKAAVKKSKKGQIKKKSKQTKRVLRMKQPKKSMFKVKDFQKHLKKPLNPAGKTKNRNSEPKLKPEPKAKAAARHQDQLHPGPKIQSSGSSSVSGSPRQKPRTKSKRTTFQNQNLSQSRPTQTKSKTKRLKSKSRRTLVQNHNTSQSRTPTFRSQSGPGSAWSSVWDTSVQASIRVGDWKLLTGDQGHGDWIPLQVLPTLLGRWWDLERSRSPSPPKTTWLFNITADPYERRDLADRRPDVVQKLLARLAYYNQTAVPVYYPPDDPRADPRRHGGAWVPWAEEEEEGPHGGVHKEGVSGRKRRRRKKKTCPLCKLKAHFLKVNMEMNRI